MEENARLIRVQRRTLTEAAQLLGVNPDIHPDDFIFDFLVHNPVFDSSESAIAYYFDDGANSAQKLKVLLSDVCNISDNSLSLLEFASGYGCVSRHIPKVLPNCSLTACDIHPEAVRFTQDVLGINAILSTTLPESLDQDRKFDVVFALSFFSHMPKATFTRWMRALIGLLENGGFLLFTTHGLASRVHFPQSEFDADGYYFSPTSEQKDLDSTEYGTSLVKPEYVFSQIFNLPDCHILHFSEGFWWNHQDLYILRKGDTE